MVRLGAMFRRSSLHTQSPQNKYIALSSSLPKYLYGKEQNRRPHSKPAKSLRSTYQPYCFAISSSELSIHIPACDISHTATETAVVSSTRPDSLSRVSRSTSINHARSRLCQHVCPQALIPVPVSLFTLLKSSFFPLHQEARLSVPPRPLRTNYFKHTHPWANPFVLRTALSSLSLRVWWSKPTRANDSILR